MLELNLSLGDLRDIVDEARVKLAAKTQAAAQALGMATHARIVEMAQQELHSTRDPYIQALSFKQERNSFTIILDKSAMWIEEGMKPHEMIDDLVFGNPMGNRPRMSRNGSYYKIVPFDVSKPPTSTPASSMAVRDAAMAALRKAGVGMRKIERNEDGSPKMGTLHRLNVTDAPIKTVEGVGQGHGPVGAVRQGMSGIPFLENMNVIQRMVGSSAGGQAARPVRQAMLFRIVSTAQKGTGRWFHPGLQPKRFFEKAHEWAGQEWEGKIKPEILADLQQDLRR